MLTLVNLVYGLNGFKPSPFSKNCLVVAFIGATCALLIIFSVPVDSLNMTDNGMCLSASVSVCCVIGQIMALSSGLLCFVLVLGLRLDIFVCFSLVS